MKTQALVDKLTDEQVTEFAKKNSARQWIVQVTKGVDTYKAKILLCWSGDPNPAPKPEVKPDVTNPQPQDITTIVKKAVSAAVEPF